MGTVTSTTATVYALKFNGGIVGEFKSLSDAETAATKHGKGVYFIDTLTQVTCVETAPTPGVKPTPFLAMPSALAPKVKSLNT
jgi:hypothetical protein